MTPARTVSGVNGLSVTVLNGSPERRDISGVDVKGKKTGLNGFIYETRVFLFSLEKFILGPKSLL